MGEEVLRLEVSIPSSSGQVFQLQNESVDVAKKKRFQSLLHQVRSSNGEGWRCVRILWLSVSIPSSSGQVFQRSASSNIQQEGVSVSIPSSSGQVFQPPRLGSGRAGASSFQSLLHQVRSSNRDRQERLDNLPRRFNPFFIRSGLPTGPGPGNGAQGVQGFNPFFIRSGLPTGIPCARCSSSSSFNPFFIRSGLPTRMCAQNLLWDFLGFNPFFIRSGLPTTSSPSARRRGKSVSIPSSSGQVFQRRIPPGGGGWRLRFQSLLHQVRSSNPHSGTRSSPRTRRFNPFFIRSGLPTVR